MNLNTVMVKNPLVYKGLYLKNGKFYTRLTMKKNAKTIQFNIPGGYDTAKEAYKARCKYIDSLK